MAPKLLKTLEAAANIDGEVGANIAATAIERALPSDQGKQIAALSKEAISGTSKSIGEASNYNLKINREAIKPGTKQAIKAHPHREAVKEFFKNLQ